MLKTMHRGRILCAYALATFTLQNAMAQSTQPSLVVMTMESSDLDAESVAPLSEYLLTELQATGRYQVIGGSDVAAMLEMEVQKQLTGCDDTDCLAQIAGALNAEFLASSSLGKVGDGYLFNLKIISSRDTTVLARATTKSTGHPDDLMAAIRAGVRVITSTSGIADTWPRVTALPLSLWGTAVAALGVGIGFGVKTMGHYRDFSNPAFLEVEQAQAAGRQSQMVANLAFGTAAVAAISGVLVWWFTGDRVEVMQPGESEVRLTASHSGLGWTW